MDYGSRGTGRKLLPGIVRGFKDATIQYISEIDNSVLVELPMDLITGDTFCASCEIENDREREERLNEAAERAKDVKGRRMRGGIEEGSGGEYDSMDGGFSHEGGGFNPMMDQGDSESIGFDATGSNVRAIGDSGANSFIEKNSLRGVQDVRGVEANMNGIGR